MWRLKRTLELRTLQKTFPTKEDSVTENPTEDSITEDIKEKTITKGTLSLRTLGKHYH